MVKALDVSWRIKCYNVEEAVKVTNARQLDLSSSIELSPGIKDPDKIKDFMRALEKCNFETNLDKIS